jgi:hypothetical protein
MLDKIQNLRNEVGNNMDRASIERNIQELILFGNLGQAGQSTQKFVQERRREAQSKTSILREIENATSEAIDTYIEKLRELQTFENLGLAQLKTKFLEAKNKSFDSEETVTAFKLLSEAIKEGQRELRKQKGSAQEAELDYDEESIKPFLVKKGRLVHSDEKIARKDPNEEALDMYHMTSFRNLLSIQKNGLDPSYGAKKGGSCSIGGGEELQKSSKKNTKGKIAAGTSNAVVATYVHQRGAWAELVQDTPIANFEIMLRFKSTLAKDWVIDPDHPNGAWHSETLIPSNAIECLIFDGWVPIKSVDLDDLLGEHIYPEDGPSQGPTFMAFTLDNLTKTFPMLNSLKKYVDNPTALLEEMEKDFYQSISAPNSSASYLLKGTTAHPIGEPKEWLFVIVTNDLDKDESGKARFNAAIKLYNEKIGDQGWGK